MSIVSRGGGLEAPLSFKMTRCHVIVLEKVFVIGWRKEIIWTRDGEGLMLYNCVATDFSVIYVFGLLL